MINAKTARVYYENKNFQLERDIISRFIKEQPIILEYISEQIISTSKDGTNNIKFTDELLDIKYLNEIGEINALISL